LKATTYASHTYLFIVDSTKYALALCYRCCQVCFSYLLVVCQLQIFCGKLATALLAQGRRNYEDAQGGSFSSCGIKGPQLIAQLQI